MKEEYATSENLARKTAEWLAQIENRSGLRKELKFDPQSSALLVLDMQRFFTDLDSHAYVPTTRAITPKISELIDYFRGIGRPVIYTRHSLKNDEDPGTMSLLWRDVVREGTIGSELSTSLKYEASETMIRKTRYSAFVGTGLEDVLRESGSKSVVVTGVTTHLCCDTTSRDAFMKDFLVYFVVDATATWTEELHLSSLRALSDGVVVPMTTEQIRQDGRR